MKCINLVYVSIQFSDDQFIEILQLNSSRFCHNFKQLRLFFHEKIKIDEKVKSKINGINAWNSYFPDENPTENYTSNESISRTLIGRYFVNNCEFDLLQRAVYINANSENTKLLVFRSSFTLCYSSGEGS